MTVPSSPAQPSLLATLRTRLGAPPPLDEAFHQSIEQAIEKAEANSGAEIVLVVRPQSGSYRDICWLFGAAVAWLGLWGIIYAPFHVHPWAVLVDTLLIFFFASWVAGRTSIRRWMATRKRLDRQTVDGLRLALFEEGVMETPGSTGILVYWSRLEQRIETCADSGVERQLPPEALHAFQFALRQAEHEIDPKAAIIAAIECLSEQLAKYVPIPAGHVRILPNRPRANP